jgi:hypothetical protein
MPGITPAKPQEVGTMEPDALQTCIEICLRCADHCEANARACREQTGADELAHCAALARDCAEFCRMAATFMQRGSHYSAEICRVCAELCDVCSAACREQDHAACQSCADVCHACASECRHLTTAMICI